MFWKFIATAAIGILYNLLKNDVPIKNINDKPLLESEPAEDQINSVYNILYGKNSSEDFNCATGRSLGNYVSHCDSFRTELEYLKDSVKQYLKHETIKKPLNILMVAPPGTGKSYLVEQLKDEISENKELVYEEYHVAAMRTIDDLMSVYQRIQSISLDNKVPIIFFDEIDAKVENTFLYPYLLAPMASGKFYDGSVIHSIGAPTILVFAGSSIVPQPALEQAFNPNMRYSDWRTKIDVQLRSKLKNKELSKENTTNTNTPIKQADFLDRIDIFIPIPDIKMNFEDRDTEKELIQLAYSLIKKHFKSISEVEKDAIISLVYVLMDAGFRAAESYVILSNVPKSRNNIFRFHDLPDKLRKEVIDNNTGIKNSNKTRRPVWKFIED